jgi:hypothetical protein
MQILLTSRRGEDLWCSWLLAWKVLLLFMLSAING